MGMINGAKILITGGTGSLGTALTERLLSGRNGVPDKVVIFSRDELKQAEMRAAFPDKRLQFIIGDIRNQGSIELALQNIDIIFNAAAMKRVEACQRFPSEAFETNCIGANNIVKSIQRYSLPIDTVVGVSSDKGCHPQNVYGATKFLQEQILLAANQDCLNTRFVAVCYGNVLGSRGSVIPIFQSQVREGRPVTVRDEHMTRFLISLDQAVDTLLEALECAQAGEIYIPIIPAATVMDIARVMIGRKRQNPIRITGKGIGEKIHEILITEEDAPRVGKRGNYYVVTNNNIPKQVLFDEYCSKDYLISQNELRNLFLKFGFIKENE